MSTTNPPLFYLSTVEKSFQTGFDPMLQHLSLRESSSPSDCHILNQHENHLYRIYLLWAVMIGSPVFYCSSSVVFSLTYMHNIHLLSVIKS